VSPTANPKSPKSPRSPPPLPPVQRVFRQAVRVCVTFSLAIGAADVAGKHAPASQRAIWFALAGGTTALVAWLGWAWLVKRARGS
jgi:hypothetical protein